MPKKMSVRIGERDFDLLGALDRCPLTVRQLRKLSETFGQRFSSEDNLRRRLRQLISADLVRSFQYATAGRGESPQYFKLSTRGYRMLHGAHVAIPKRSYFAEVRPAHHQHTRCLAEVIVHVCVTASRHGCQVLHFARENSVRIHAEPFTVYPDCAFVIRDCSGRSFPFVLELDNATERVRSSKDVESIERKLRTYDTHQSQYDRFDPNRYLVLFITTRSERRLRTILNVAADVMRQPQRRVFLGSSLQALLASDPFQQPAFEDHRCLRRTLIPAPRIDRSHQTTSPKTASFSLSA